MPRCRGGTGVDYDLGRSILKLLHYEVLGQIGEGAGSTIHAVRDPERAGAGPFALKHVRRNKPKDIRFVEQMETEYQVSQKLAHANLRRCFELRIQRTLLGRVQEAFLLMELVRGRPLEEQQAPLEPSAAVEIFIQAAQGLEAMHAAGYVHCDIKPNNLMVTEEGTVKIIDFGQSCPVGTVKERIQGTPDYMAPEQAERRPVSPQTDIFNLGATIYWALTGQTIPTLYNVSRNGQQSFLVQSLIPTPEQHNPRVPPSLSKLVMDCVSAREAGRPADMAAVLKRLELVRYAMGLQSPAPSP